MSLYQVKPVKQILCTSAGTYRARWIMDSIP